MLPTQYQYTGKLHIQVRFDHEECGDKRSRLYVKNTGKGLLYHCHNCGFSGYHRHGLLSPEQTLTALNQYQEDDEVFQSDYLEYPFDFSPKVPKLGLLWLYKYGLTDEEVLAHGFGSYNGGERLFIPVYVSKKLIYYQGRNLNLDKPKSPKYLNVRAKNAKLIYKEVKHTRNDIVLVEDVVSAIKVGRVSTARALLGSYIPLELILSLMGRCDKVYVWLDPDKAAGAVKYSAKIRSITGLICKPIFTEKDPKDYSTEEIKRILE